MGGGGGGGMGGNGEGGRNGVRKTGRDTDGGGGNGEGGRNGVGKEDRKGGYTLVSVTLLFLDGMGDRYSIEEGGMGCVGTMVGGRGEEEKATIKGGSRRSKAETRKEWGRKLQTHICNYLE